MNTWFRKVGMGAFALTLAGVLGGCNNGGGGNGILLYFGINGSGSCDVVVVDVDLEDADAEIARDAEGAVQCVLDQDLEDDGCDIDFEEDGGHLIATISGCTIQGVSNLFSCVFEHVDISDLNANATAQCDCRQEACDPTPPVCISPVRDPRSCEDCDNGVDDDDDGEVDCDDPDCSNDPVCNGTTTSTTSTTSTTTTSSTSTTTTTTTSSTTTTGEPPLTCTVVFHLEGDDTLGALQFKADYSNAPGSFSGQEGEVQCNSLVTGALPAFKDFDSEEFLNAGLIKLAPGFQAPTDVVECIFKAFTQPVPSDFTVTTTEATDPDGVQIVPTPVVSVNSGIECTGPSTTTTTLGGPTTTLNVPTTTVVGATNYSITYKVLTAAESVGAIQIESDYSAATGGFEGVGEAVNCTSSLPLPAFFDQDGNTDPKTPQEILNAGAVLFPAKAAPFDIGTCVFNGDPNDPPVVGDFVNTIIDSTNGTGTTIAVTIGMTITPIP